MRTAFLAMIAAAVLAATPLRGQDPPAAQASPEPPQPPDTKPAEQEKKPPVSVGPDGFTLQSENGDFKLQLRGLLQLDGRFYLSDERALAVDTFLVRRARPILTGTVTRYFDFNFTPDFGAGNAVIQDAYLNAKGSPKLQVRVGKFKPPIGIEHLQGDPYLAFVERALPAALEPSRDVGIQLHGELGKGALAYALGVFDGTPDGASVDADVNDSKDLVGRVFLSPFRNGASALKGLGFGVSASTGKQTGALAVLAPYRTGGQIIFFNYLVTASNPAGTRTRISPELSFYSGPLGLLAEHVWAEGRLQQTGTSRFDKLQNKAWQATVTVMLTGEDAAYEGVQVKRPFDPAKGQWGALQLAARVNGFEADPDGFSLGYADITKSARKAKAFGLGLNWYLNRNIKQVVSFEHTSFEGGDAGGDQKDENVILLRAQLGF
jgi:phosphate-selective porin OprO/OprP